MDSEQEANWVLQALRGHFGSRGLLMDDLQVRPLVVDGSVLSRIYLADVEAGAGKRLPVLCKMTDSGVVLFRSELMMHFANERFFFEELLPFLLGPDGCGDEGARQCFPQYHFTHEDDEKCLIVMENLGALGFATASRTLDFQHAVFALQALGRFHALSYVAKKRQPERFHSLMGRLQYPRKSPSLRSMFEMINQKFVRHTVDLFRKAKPAGCAKYSRQLEDVVSDVTELYGRLYEGREPTAVLCHGDYKSENMLVRNDVQGNPLALKLIDFQLISYSSPAIDVILILFLSTAVDIWESHWDSLVAVYHDELLATLSGYLKCSVQSLHTELGPEVFRREFKDYCHHAFYVANFFEPLRTLDKEHYYTLIKIVIEEPTNEEKIKPLLVDLFNSYSDKMNYYVMAMLQKVLELKASS